MIESDFYSTQAGREHFRNQLQSIRCAPAFRAAPAPPPAFASRLTRPFPRRSQTAFRRWVSDHESAPPRARAHAPLFRAQTCNFDVLYSYLTCTNYDFRYDMQKG
jgi:hypothetical protein